MARARFITSVASYAGQTRAHWRHLAEAEPVGMYLVENESDVALARNKQLTQVAKADQAWDVLLLVDDDVFFRSSPEVQLLVQEAHESHQVTAALYPTARGEVKCRIYRDEGGAYLLTGAGALAIPFRVFMETMATRRSLSLSPNEGILEFCRSGADPSGLYWWSEDYWLTYNLGGVAVSSTVNTQHRKSKMVSLGEQAFTEALEVLQQRLQSVDS